MTRKDAAPALLLLAFAAPAAAQTAEQDYQAGVAARQAGDLDEALGRLERAAAAEPANADIFLQMGLVYLAMSRLDEAETAFRHVLDLAPDYADARLGLARVARRRRDRETALAELDRIGPGHAEADEMRRQILGTAAVRPWRWNVGLDGSYTDVDRLADWQSATLVVQHRVGRSMIVTATADATRRFRRTDIYGEARVDYRFAPGAYVHALVGGTPDAEFRPEYQLGAGAAIRTHGGPYATVAQMEFRQARYPAGDVQTLTPGIEQYLGERAWVTVHWVNTWDRFRHSSGWLVRGDVMPNGRLRLFAGVADAPDLDAGVVIDTRSLFGGVSLDVGEHLTLRFSFAHDDSPGPADRDTLALGMGFRF